MGDFNARTGVANDFIESDHICQADEGTLPSDYLENLLLPKRFNIDKIISEQLRPTFIRFMHWNKATYLKWEIYWRLSRLQYIFWSNGKQHNWLCNNFRGFVSFI